MQNTREQDGTEPAHDEPDESRIESELATTPM